MPNKCYQCGADLRESDKFCVKCGITLKNRHSSNSRRTTRQRASSDNKPEQPSYSKFNNRISPPPPPAPNQHQAPSNDQYHYSSSDTHLNTNPYPNRYPSGSPHPYPPPTGAPMNYPPHTRAYYPYPYYPTYPPGYYYRPKQPIDILRIMAAIPVIPSYIFLGVIFLINLIFLILGLGIVTPNLFSNSGIVMMIYPWPNFLYPITISGGLLVAWYIFLVVSIVISIIWLIKKDGLEFIKIFINSAKKINPPPMKFKNSIVLIFQFFFALIFFNLFIILILVMFGALPSSPLGVAEPALWEWFFNLANASVAEEIITKVLYIGIPLLLFDIIARRPKNKLHRYLVGGGFKIESITIVLIIFSSLLFGFAHYPGWGLWKVVPTFVAGLAFGYLYVSKGIHTSIILHFLIDYMVMVEIFFMDNQTVFIIIVVFMGLLMILWSVSGSLYFSLFTYKIFERFVSGLSISKPVPSMTGAQYYGSPSYGNTGYYYPYPYYYNTPYPGSNGSAQPGDYSTSTEFAEERTDVRPQPAYHPHSAPMQPPVPPPVPETNRERYCPTCKTKLKYSQYANSYYCENCLKYIF